MEDLVQPRQNPEGLVRDVSFHPETDGATAATALTPVGDSAAAAATAADESDLLAKTIADVFANGELNEVESKFNLGYIIFVVTRFSDLETSVFL